MATVKKKLSNLELVLQQFIMHTDEGLSKLEKEMLSFKEEMLAFKEEMLAFKEEMRVFKDQMIAFKEEMRIFKDEEMRVFKDQMIAFREDQQREHKRTNQEWANLAKKMGTLVEDLVAPAIKPIIQKYFQRIPLVVAQRVVKRMGGETCEIDLLAVSEDMVFMVEVVSSARIDDVNELIKKASGFYRFFPEYSNLKLIPILSTITFQENIVRYATRKKVYLLAYREWEYMDIINFYDIKQ